MRAWILVLLCVAVVCSAGYQPRKSPKGSSDRDKLHIDSRELSDDVEEKDFADIEEDAKTELTKVKKREKTSKSEERFKKEKKLREKYGSKGVDEIMKEEHIETVATISSNDLFNIGRDHRIQDLKEKLSQTSDPQKKAELLKEKELVEDDATDDDEDKRYEACTSKKNMLNKNNELCHCDGDEIDCSRTVLDDFDSHLRTANVIIQLEEFKPIVANFSENGIRRLEAKKILPESEATVSVLDFSHNEIRYIDSSAFSAFKNLTRLNLGSNNLQLIKKKWFDGIEDTLHRLDLSNNKVKNLPDNVFDGLTNLKKLILDGNPIKSWNKEQFKGLENLEELSLDNCDIDSLPGDLFEYLPKLTGISLRSNPLDEIPAAALNQKKLIILDLSETSIPEVRTEAFGTDSNLEEVIMENMKYLTSIRDCAFCGLAKLKTLVLANNPKLLELHQNAFGFISSTPGKKSASLTELHLQNGDISSISEQMLEYDKLESFRIGGNPWNCTCETKFLMDSTTFTYKQDSSFPKCASPKELKDRNLATLHAYEACDQVRSEHRTGRMTTVLGLLLIVGFIICFIVYLFMSGKLTTLLRKAQNVPEVSYSNLNNRSSDDSMSLDSDFEPRAAEL